MLEEHTVIGHVGLQNFLETTPQQRGEMQAVFSRVVRGEVAAGAQLGLDLTHQIPNCRPSDVLGERGYSLLW